jgi:hypothetical protein
MAEKIKATDPSFAWLHSDFTSATDAVPHVVSRIVLETLFDEFGLIDRHSFLLRTLGPREIHIGKEKFLSQRGILMGEPFSKIVLITTVLAAEEIVFSEHFNLSLERQYTKSQLLTWRAFHVGGDDHKVYGPITYLKRLTEFNRSIGYLISENSGKHIMTRHAGLYTEKMFFYHGKDPTIPVSQINYKIDESIFVDSIKLRLLSPFSKPIDARGDRNIAIGKAKQLTRTIRWLDPKGPLGTIARNAVTRFTIRFANYIPRPHRKTLTSIMRLPVSLGGLGLVFNPTEVSYKNLPKIWKDALYTLYANSNSRESLEVHKILQSVWSNTETSMSPETLKERDRIIESESTVTFKEITEEFFKDKKLPGGYLDKVQALEKEGFLPLERYLMYFDRPHRFRNFLRGKPRKQFNTSKYITRCSNAWKKLQSLSLLDSKDIQVTEILNKAEKAIKTRPLWVYLELPVETKSIAECETIDDLVGKTLRDNITDGPSLRMDKRIYYPSFTVVRDFVTSYVPINVQRTSLQRYLQFTKLW